MTRETLQSGQVLWCYEHELKQANLADEFRSMLSFSMPLHYHEGHIVLNHAGISIDGDINLHIPLNNLQQLYLGFDEHYKRLYVKNGGLLWQPLRITYNDGGLITSVYLIIDYNWFGANNQQWYDTLKALFE